MDQLTEQLAAQMSAYAHWSLVKAFSRFCAALIAGDDKIEGMVISPDIQYGATQSLEQWFAEMCHTTWPDGNPIEEEKLRRDLAEYFFCTSMLSGIALTMDDFNALLSEELYPDRDEREKASRVFEANQRTGIQMMAERCAACEDSSLVLQQLTALMVKKIQTAGTETAHEGGQIQVLIDALAPILCLSVVATKPQSGSN
ncbi:MAG: hypothetical protein PHY34_03265 [Patescibacteria group bacterium]|nr:hypothetical protein [Patescibacteria group bacterium]MDD5716106.1 hypothetical protein [Patescibacteria group bacterium]